MLTIFNYASMYLKRFVKDEKGQGMVEYGLIIALIAAVAILSLTNVGTAVKNLFTGIATSLTPAP